MVFGLFGDDISLGSLDNQGFGNVTGAVSNMRSRGNRFGGFSNELGEDLMSLTQSLDQGPALNAAERERLQQFQEQAASTLDSAQLAGTNQLAGTLGELQSSFGFAGIEGGGATAQAMTSGATAQVQDRLNQLSLQLENQIAGFRENLLARSRQRDLDAFRGTQAVQAQFESQAQTNVLNAFSAASQQQGRQLSVDNANRQADMAAGGLLLGGAASLATGGMAGGFGALSSLGSIFGENSFGSSSSGFNTSQMAMRGTIA